MTSHGSTIAANDTEGIPNADDLSALEAEINTIKTDVLHMRADAENKHRSGEQTPTMRQHDLPPRTEGSRIPAPASGQPMPRISDPSKRAATSSSSKVPALTGTSKRSYAQTGTSKLRGPPATTSGSQQGGNDTSSPQQTYYDAVEYLHGTPSSDKSSPHFAQSTQAATHRVDQTLRKDTSIKPSPETSPGKSTKAKAPNFETDKRAAQRQQKRTSLPEGWMSTPEQASSAEKSLPRKEQVVPRGTLSSSPAGDYSSSTSTGQKKTSSYMSPTKSAQHRNIATIGLESPKRMSPRLKARGLTISTIAANEGAGTKQSGLRAGRDSDSDDVFYSPRSSFSKPSSRTVSPLKSGAFDKTPLAGEFPRARPAIRLPAPLPQVTNTVISPRDPSQTGQNFLDSIREQLGKKDLLRRDSTQQQKSLSARRGSRSDILRPVFSRLDRSGHTGFASRPSTQARDSINEPISQLITGLRGQRSAAIGKALAIDQHESTDTPRAIAPAGNQIADPAIAYQGGKPSTESALSQTDPAIVYQGRKPSTSTSSLRGDPAILYQGRKPSASTDLPHDPAIKFSLGDAPRALSFRKASQPSSLRATAMDFVPSLAPEPVPQIDTSAYVSRHRMEPWELHQPVGLSLFDEEKYESPGMTDEQRIAMLPPIIRPDLLRLWHEGQAQRFEEEYPLMPQPTGPGHFFDLIHGDVSSPSDNTPTISPTSGDTSPPWSSSEQSQNAQLQNTPGNWSISGRGRRGYHWTGRDGLEISFKGVGPDAEHDPNSPVLYRNFRANTKTLHMQAASFPRNQIPGTSLPPNAPRLMRDYAEKTGLDMVPCMNDQWQGKYNTMPAIVPMAGLCPCCKNGDHTLHRIGGGIDLVSQRLVPSA